MTIIVGLQFIPSLVLIPFKCPPGIYFQILKQQLVNPKARSPLHSPSSCSPRCGPRFTGPFSFVCRFIFRVKEKKKNTLQRRYSLQRSRFLLGGGAICVSHSGRRPWARIPARTRRGCLVGNRLPAGRQRVGAALCLPTSQHRKVKCCGLL